MNQRIDIQVVLRGGSRLHHFRLGRSEVQQRCDVDAGFPKQIRVRHAAQRQAAEEGDSNRTITVDQAGQRIGTALHHLGSLKVGNLAQHAGRFHVGRREKVEVDGMPMTEPEGQRGAAVEHEVTRRVSQLAPESLLRWRKPVAAGLRHAGTSHLLIGTLLRMREGTVHDRVIARH